MSRNLLKDECYFCGGAVVLDEERRPITPGEAGVYFAEYEGMLVANARCPDCEAKYLAWVDERTRKQSAYWARGPADCGFMDLSFRSTFNDEPGADDLPRWAIKRRVIIDREPFDRSPFAYLEGK